MRRIIFMLVVATTALAACGDNLSPAVRDGAPEDTQPPDGPPIDTPPQALAACLDRPDGVPMPPTGALPCELLPPGFRVEVP